MIDRRCGHRHVGEAESIHGKAKIEILPSGTLSMSSSWPIGIQNEHRRGLSDSWTLIRGFCVFSTFSTQEFHVIARGAALFHSQQNYNYNIGIARKCFITVIANNNDLLLCQLKLPIDRSVEAFMFAPNRHFEMTEQYKYWIMLGARNRFLLWVEVWSVRPPMN